MTADERPTNPNVLQVELLDLGTLDEYTAYVPRIVEGSPLFQAFRFNHPERLRKFLMKEFKDDAYYVERIMVYLHNFKCVNVHRDDRQMYPIIRNRSRPEFMIG